MDSFFWPSTGQTVAPHQSQRSLLKLWPTTGNRPPAPGAGIPMVLGALGTEHVISRFGGSFCSVD